MGLAGNYFASVDVYTVKVFSKWSKSTVMLTVEEIETAFANKEGESQVFPGLNSVQRKEVLTCTKEMRKINYRIFLDLMSECRH